MHIAWKLLGVTCWRLLRQVTPCGHHQIGRPRRPTREGILTGSVTMCPHKYWHSRPHRRCDTARQLPVTAYLSSKQLPLFAFTRQHPAILVCPCTDGIPCLQQKTTRGSRHPLSPARPHSHAILADWIFNCKIQMAWPLVIWKSNNNSPASTGVHAHILHTCTCSSITLYKKIPNKKLNSLIFVYTMYMYIKFM